MITRTCKTCGVTKELNQLVRDKMAKYGHKAWCNDCANKYNKSRQDYCHTKRKVVVPKYTPDGLQILIKYGYARNEEEARRYISECGI